MHPLDEHALWRVLRWDVGADDAGSIADAVRRMRVRFTTALLIKRLHSLSPGHARQANEHLSEMTDRSLECVLISPAVFELAQSPSPQAALQLLQLLTIEARLGLGEEPGVAGWTALGDRWIGPLADMPGDRAIRGPIPCRLPIDLSRPELLVNPTAGLQATEPLGIDDLVMVGGLIDDALGTLEERAPGAHDLVQRLTANVVVRLEATPRRRVRSASSPAAIGRTVLLNVTGPDSSLVPVMESLVHESIHAFLSSFELEHPFVPAGPAQPVRSPWTGDVLPLRALVHACFVWFGLFMLRQRRHQRAPQPAEAPTTPAGNGADDLHAGFRRLDLGDLDRRGVSPSCLAVIDEARREVLYP